VSAARSKRACADPDATSVVGEGRDRDVLASIAWAGYLTTGQVAALHFPTRRRAQRRLRALLDHGLVRAHLQGEALQRESFFTPTARGLEWLAERDAFPQGAPRALPLPRLQKLAHSLGIRDAFVAFVRAEAEGLFALDDFRFDGDLVGDPRFAPERLIPDGLARVSRGGAALLVGVEHDRGTETTTTLRAKFTAWASAASRLTATGAPPVRLVVTVVGERRAATVRRVLGEAGVGAWASVCLAGDLGALLASGWPYGVAARGGRAERPPESPETAGFQPFRAAGAPAFGAHGRVRL